MNPPDSPAIPIAPVFPWDVVPVAEPAAAVQPQAGVPTRSRVAEQTRRMPESTQSLADVVQTVSWIFDVVVEIVFGIFSMWGGLAVLASLPVLNFISLGYLLEAGGRIARTGRFFDGFFGIRRAGRVGGLLLGMLLTLLPVVFVSSMAQSAELIDPTSDATRNWKIGLTFAMVAAVLNIALACLWGGKFRHFLPFLHPVYAVLHLAQACGLLPQFLLPYLLLIFAFVPGNPFTRARDGVWTFWVEARLWYFFWLGLRGAVGALLWLAVPVTLLAVGWKQGLWGLLGFVLLLPVLMILPFLQMQFAATGKFKKLFNALLVVRLYVRAPWACSFALFITLLFALPLYLLKIEVVPRDALMLPAVVFIMFIWPARLLTGWVCGRAIRRERPRHWFWWITGAMPVPLVLVVYGFFVWGSQYFSWYGVASLYEQHAFLLPVPFTGL